MRRRVISRSLFRIQNESEGESRKSPRPIPFLPPKAPPIPTYLLLLLPLSPFYPPESNFLHYAILLPGKEKRERGRRRREAKFWWHAIPYSFG